MSTNNDYDDDDDEKFLIALMIFLLWGVFGIIAGALYSYVSASVWYKYITVGIGGGVVGLVVGGILVGIQYKRGKSQTNLAILALVGIVVTILMFIFYPSNDFVIKEDKTISSKSEAKKEPCKNVDDCLYKYNFEEARKYAYEIPNKERGFWSDPDTYKGKELKKIIQQESIYWINQNEFDRALLTIDEFPNDIFAPSDRYTNTNYYIEQKYKLRFEILNKIIDKLLYNANFTKAKEWANKGAADRDINGVASEKDDFKSDQIQRDVLLSIVSKAHK